jgi:hypothetical protein
MAKKTLLVRTPYGDFTRTTNTAYTHVVVAVPASRCGKTFESAADLAAKLTAEGNHKSGVMARVLKDRGYIVSWHSTAAAALRAADAGNSAYFSTKPGQVFAVARELEAL